MAAIADKITLGWWNTGLSPAGKQRASQAQLRSAVDIVQNLLLNEGVDWLSLGEVTKFDLDYCLNAIGLPMYAYFDGMFRQGRSQFDTGAIFNQACITSVCGAPIFDRFSNRTIKLANEISFTLNQDPASTFFLFISHWPSHIVPDSEDLRITLAARLCKEIQKLNDSVPNAHIILMGDWNEEPFHSCLQHHLLATRDRSLAQRQRSLFYHPFWRHLGETQPYYKSEDTPITSFAGTCYVSSAIGTRWKTVDQIVFSSVFLGRSEWHLNERSVKILHITPKGLNPRSAPDIFDHFPVIATVEKMVEGEKND